MPRRRVLRLIPVLEPWSNIPLPICLDTKDASSADSSVDTVTVTLGRNSRTFVADSRLSRAVCDVSLSSFSYFAEGDAFVASSSASSSHGSSNLHGGRGEGCSIVLQMRKAPGEHRVNVDNVPVTFSIGCPVTLRDGAVLRLFGHRYGHRLDLTEPVASDDGVVEGDVGSIVGGRVARRWVGGVDEDEEKEEEDCPGADMSPS